MDVSLKALGEALVKLGESFEKHSAQVAAGAMGWLFLTALRKAMEHSLCMDTQLQEAHEDLRQEQEMQSAWEKPDPLVNWRSSLASGWCTTLLAIAGIACFLVVCCCCGEASPRVVDISEEAKWTRRYLVLKQNTQNRTTQVQYSSLSTLSDKGIQEPQVQTQGSGLNRPLRTSAIVTFPPVVFLGWDSSPHS